MLRAQLFSDDEPAPGFLNSHWGQQDKYGLCVRNTFLDVVDTPDPEQRARALSLPGRPCERDGDADRSQPLDGFLDALPRRGRTARRLFDGDDFADDLPLLRSSGASAASGGADGSTEGDGGRAESLQLQRVDIEASALEPRLGLEDPQPSLRSASLTSQPAAPATPGAPVRSASLTSQPAAPATPGVPVRPRDGSPPAAAAEITPQKKAACLDNLAQLRIHYAEASMRRGPWQALRARLCCVPVSAQF
eukprot:TRINITY_DN5256_c0_g1_i1.p1 TRINITY_DN5256_c0_g1~~TRINITY_DN5256_c0_g1_i1.p1  ORF type:complete len:271 (-),score=53.20 TRINITY_DN5256_c0_g1_i1:22-768(-)